MGHPYGPASIADPEIAPPRRMIRACASALAATVLGLLGHIAGGGTPTLAGAALAVLAVLAPSFLLAGRERGWAVIAGVQVAAQQVMHPLLVTASDTAAATAPAALPHDLMFFLHVLGALLMAAWLRLGERRVWAAARRLAARLARWTRLLLDPPRPLPAVAPSARPGPDRTRPRPAPLRHVVSRRGPPLPA